MTPSLHRDTFGLASAFLVSGTAHLLRPQLFDPLIPPRLPAHRAIIYASGVAEIACGLGLLHPRTRRGAGWASAAALLTVWPGNVQMSLNHAERVRRRGDLASRAAFAATLVRLPLQVPLIRIALRAARG
jgi:uncharacterized membrane protein